MNPRTFLKRFWHWSIIIPIVFFILIIVFALHGSIDRTNGHFIYSLDDAYIHMAMAKNFARHGLWGCTPYHFSSASSSLLWTFLLGCVYSVTGVHDLTPLILNIVFAIWTLLLTYHYLEKFSASPLLRATALTGIIIAFPMSGMVLMGMEHILHLLLTIWFSCIAIETLTQTRSNPVDSQKQTIYLAILAIFLGMSRYEGFFLIGLVCLGLLIQRQWIRGITLGIVSFIPVVVFGFISLANHAFFFPNSLMLKAGGQKISAFSALFKLPGSEDIIVFRKNRELLVLVGLGLIAAIILWVKERKFWRSGVLAPLLLSLMTLMHVHYAFSPVFWVYRYAAYLVAFGVFAAALVWIELKPEETPFRKFPRAVYYIVMIASFGFLLILISDVQDGIYPQKELLSTQKTFYEHYTAAQFVRIYYPQEPVVINDLGAMAYYTDTRVLDLFGLGDMEPLLIQHQTGVYTGADIAAWTGIYHPEIAVIQLSWGYIARRIPDQWIKVAEVKMPLKRRRIGFFAVDPTGVETLKHNVRAFYGPLCEHMKYEMKIF